MRCAALVLTATLAVASMASAQDTGIESNLPGAGFDKPHAPSGGSAPTLQVYSRETIVDVTVTDADGHPVHGLKPSDFTLLEDGKPVTLSSFAEHGGAQVSAAASVTPTAPLPPNTFTNVTPPVGAAAGPPIILVIDSMDTPIATQTVVQQRMLDFVARMPPATRLEVLAISTTGQLSILQGFTSDRDLLRAAINSKKLAGQPPPLEDAGQDPDDPEPPTPAIVECNRAAMRGEYSLTAMNQLARYLSGIPDRKNLIWLAGSVPLMMPEDGSCYDFTEAFKAASGRLASAHAVVYPIDPRAMDLVANPQICPRGPVTCPAVQRQTREHLTGEAIAEQTGGQTYFNTNDLGGAVQQAIDAGSSYYTLTYVPPDRKLDSRFRSIKVTMDRPGMHLTYREGYYAIPPNTTLAGKKIDTLTPMQAAMQRGSLAPTQILFSTKITQTPAPAAILPAENHPDGNLLRPPYRTYSLAFSVDVHNIQFTQTPDGNYRASFELAVTVYNSGGDAVLNSASKTVSPILPPAVYKSMLRSGASAHLDIAAPATGDYFLRIAVRDLASDQVGAIEVPTSSIAP